VSLELSGGSFSGRPWFWGEAAPQPTGAPA